MDRIKKPYTETFLEDIGEETERLPFFDCKIPCKSRISESKKKYYEKNKEEIIRKNREYYEREKEKINRRRREKYKEEQAENL